MAAAFLRRRLIKLQVAKLEYYGCVKENDMLSCPEVSGKIRTTGQLTNFVFSISHALVLVEFFMIKMQYSKKQEKNN